MPYQYLDHTADLGIRGIGDTLQEAFDQGAQAMLDAIAEVHAHRPQLTCPVTCSAPDVPALFVEWLNELLYQAEIRGALWQSAHVTHLAQSGTEWTLHGTACGEPIDLARHTLHTEVKAATYAGLSYRQRAGQHILECVLDL
jgi:SHS2 domain-containing protein